jgi:hypothetical protein
MKKYIVTSGVFAGIIFYSKYAFNDYLLDYYNLGVIYKKSYCMIIETVDAENECSN